MNVARANAQIAGAEGTDLIGTLCAKLILTRVQSECIHSMTDSTWRLAPLGVVADTGIAPQSSLDYPGPNSCTVSVRPSGRQCGKPLAARPNAYMAIIRHFTDCKPKRIIL
jgi:hypothetical protein